MYPQDKTKVSDVSIQIAKLKNKFVGFYNRKTIEGIKGFYTEDYK